MSHESLDEAVLRRALRLEREERPPRLDPAALRRAARGSGGTSPWLPRVAAVCLALLALAALSTALRTAEQLVTLVLAGPALELAIAVLNLASGPLEAVLTSLTQPSVPLAIIAAVAIAILHERHLDRKEHHAGTS
jgi:hypothetical protein